MEEKLGNYVCEICGGELSETGTGRFRCAYCHTEYYKETSLPEELVLDLYSANRARSLQRFEDALNEYDRIIASYPDCFDAYWGATLSDYGIQYEKDYDGRMLPTMHRFSEIPVTENKYFVNAVLYCKNENELARIKASAEEIEKIRAEIQKTVGNQEPYDIFLCYKETPIGATGGYTPEFYWADELYRRLRGNGYKVFFAKESLPATKGDYEAHIFPALKSARLMLVLTSSVENVESVWVKNEWSRFIRFAKENPSEGKRFKVIQSGFRPEFLPRELRMEQVLNHDGMGWIEQLEEVLKDTFPEKIPTETEEERLQREREEAERLERERIERERRRKRNKIITLITAPIVSIALLFTALSYFVFIPNGKYSEAVKLLNSEKYADAISAFELLNGYKDSEDRIVEAKYKQALSLMKNGKYSDAITAFEELDGYKDSVNKISECNTAILDAKYNQALSLMKNGKYSDAITAFEELDGYKDSETKISECDTAILDEKYNHALSLMHAGRYSDAVIEFEALNGYKDSISKVAECNAALSDIQNNVGKYTVEYYLENVAKSGYDIEETEKFSGLIGTTAFADQKVYEHFTLNRGICTLNGAIAADGSLVLKLYYTRAVYTVTTETNDNKYGSVTSGGTYAYDKQITLTATTKAGYVFLGWFDGNNKVCDTISYTFKINKAATYTAKWGASTQTPYKVEYYLQNVNKNGYDIISSETINTTGQTDTIAYAPEKSFEHFTIDKTQGKISGKIEGSGSLVLKVYYTRNTYTVSASATAGGTVSGSGNYAYDKQITLTATTKAGYTFLGWFEGNTKVGSNLSYTFNVSKAVTYTAKWEANTNTPYRIEYYRQNVNKNGYDIISSETINTTGKTDTTATAPEKTFDHFTINRSMGKISGNIEGNGNLVLKVYYTRNTYTVSNANTSYGTITNAGTHAYGKTVTLTASPTLLGYEFIGWYSGETLLSSESTYTFTVDKNVTTKFGVKQEMSGFNFTSTATTCQITGIKDKTVTEIIVPDYVTSISQGAFSGCSNLQSITIPFVGATKDGTSNTHFGYIFGASSFSYDDHVPSSLKTVIITVGTSIDGYAFYNCTSLTSVVIPNSVTSIDGYAFQNCDSLTSVHITDIAKWCGIDFANTNANPLCYAKKLYLNGTLVTELVIPNSVKTIGNYAFSGYDSLTSVTIGNSVETIGDYAFYGCTSLTSVTIGNSVETIGENAFSYCTSLTSVTIGSSVKTIGDYAFSSCRSLTSITVSEENTVYISIDGNLYSKDGKTLIQYAIGKTNTSFIIPDSVTSIGDYAFYGCTSLTSVVIPNNVTSIGDNAFASCDSLTSVVIPNSVTSIGSDAFASCDSLTSVHITDIAKWCGISFGSVVANPLYYANKLYLNGTLVTELVIPNSVKTIGDNAFYGCDSLTSVEIGNSVTSIGDRAFLSCSSLTSVTIGSGVTSIGDYAFSSCDKLVEVINKSTLTITKGSGSNGKVGNYALYVHNGESKIVNKDGYLFITYNGVNYLLGYVGTDTALTLPSDYNGQKYEIYKYAFYNNDKITSVVIPDSVKTIGENAFYGCDSLTSVVIGNSVTSIGNYAFQSCTSLTSITVAEENTKYKSIDGNLYSKDGKTLIQYAIGKTATSFTIPDGVTSIGSDAFYSCSSLTSVTIPNSVTSIDDRAFYECGSLTSVTIGSGVTSIGYEAFYECTSLTSVVIPNSVTSIGSEAFYNCRSLTSVTIGSGVTSIGYDAFAGCCKLVEVINKSTLNITNGSTSNGYVGYYALEIHNGESKIVNKDGYLFITSGGVNYLFGYTGTDTALTLPNDYNGQSYEINKYAFYSCDSLTSVVIPNSITSIGDRAFSSCRSLTSIKYRGTQTQWNKITKGSGWNSGSYTVICSDSDKCSTLTHHARIEAKCNETGNIEYWFCVDCGKYFSDANGNNEITDKASVILPTVGCDYIGGVCKWCGVGKGSEGLSYLISSDGTYYTVMGVGTCTDTYIVIPNTYNSKPVKEIASSAFRNQKHIVSVVVGNNVERIGDNAFELCRGLVSVTLGSSVKTIGTDVFYHCTKLVEVVNNSDLSISKGSNENGRVANYALTVHNGRSNIVNQNGFLFFEKDNGDILLVGYAGTATHLIFPEGYNGENYQIYKYAFAERTDITKITLCAGVTDIMYRAFWKCTSLATIEYIGSESQWNAVVKEENWAQESGNYTVVCTGG